MIGKEFSEPILGRVAELPSEELTEALADLRAAEFVYEKSLYPVAEYEFKHPRTQSMALDSQLQERRARHWRALRAALAALSTTPDDVRELAIEAHIQLVNLNWRIGQEPGEVERIFRRGVELAEEAADDRVLSLLYGNYGLAGGLPGELVAHC